ncbi:MAG: MmgE/PrpD family protein [Betaproteobacteria bacterium]|nr:MmgE/PrpD family protein [Betaproteobacteria bacterium]
MKAGEPVARRLAKWVVGLRYEELAAEVVQQAKRCLLDTLGVEIRGATLPWVQPVYRYVRSMGGTPEATVAYHGDRLSAPYAAYLNSTFSYSCELQHHGSFGSAHTGVIVIPTVQALGEKLDAGGREIIAAMVAGYEVQGRLGAALFGPVFKRHFHPQGVFGPFSAAAAAGKLLGLDEEQLAHSFAIAGSHASAILEYDQAGGEVKRIHGAMAARSGIQAAFMAREGLTGPLSVFEGQRGIFASFGGGESDAELLFKDLGKPYCITQCRFRIYPTIGSCHNALDIVNDILKKQPFDFKDVRKIRVGMRELSVMHVTSISRPHDVISAQASLGYSLGVRLVKGSNDLEMYIDPEIWRDPDVLSVADKLEPYALNVESKPRMTRVQIVLSGGRVLEGEQVDARGSETLPFSQEVIDGKFRRLAGTSIAGDQVERLMEQISDLERLKSIRPLVSLLQK